VTDLLQRLAQEDVRLLAGGQSLVPMMAFRLARPGHLIDLNGVDELARLSVSRDGIEIGALIRHAEIAHRPIPGVTGSLLRAVVPHIAHHPIRSRGTFCGSLAHADPASEWCLVAATLEAIFIAQSASGRREISASDYFQGAMSTDLRGDEVLTCVRLPHLPDSTRFAFREFSRRSGDFAIASALVTMDLRDGVIMSARIGIGGAEDHPRRISEAEALLIGRKLAQDAFVEAGAIVARVLTPMEDISTSAAYRRELASSLVERALEEAAQ
jgi:aerobic carbon-monoxide dehydrogenase medium subunit